MRICKKSITPLCKVNQALIICIGILAFVLDAAWLAALVALVMILGTLFGKPGFSFVYSYLLRPTGLVKPDILMDNPEPHRFAQGFGGVVLAAAAWLFSWGFRSLGWALVWLVVALAALELVCRFLRGLCDVLLAGASESAWFYQKPACREQSLACVRK